MAASELLTPQMEEFCQHFAVRRSGPCAYRHAYNVSPGTLASTIAAASTALLRDYRITNRIKEIQREATAITRGTIDLAALQQMLVDVIAVDPNELTNLRVGNCRYCNGEAHDYQWREREYVEALELAMKNGARLPDYSGGFGYREFDPPNADCPECGGVGEPRPYFADTRYLSPGALLLYQGVKKTRAGLEIIFSDRQKYIEMLGRIVGAFNDKITVTGQVGIAAALATMEAGDAHKAAEAYEAFLRAGPESS